MARQQRQVFYHCHHRHIIVINFITTSILNTNTHARISTHSSALEQSSCVCLCARYSPPFTHGSLARSSALFLYLSFSLSRALYHTFTLTPDFVGCLQIVFSAHCLLNINRNFPCPVCSVSIPDASCANVKNRSYSSAARISRPLSGII